MRGFGEGDRPARDDGAASRIAEAIIGQRSAGARDSGAGQDAGSIGARGGGRRDITAPTVSKRDAGDAIAALQPAGRETGGAVQGLSGAVSGGDGRGRDGQRRRGDGECALSGRDGIVSQRGAGAGHGRKGVGIATHVRAGGGAGDGEAVATEETCDGRGGVGAQSRVVDRARGCADNRQRSRSDREHALGRDEVIIAEVRATDRGERQAVGVRADILAGGIAADRDRVAAEQADDRRAVIILRAAIVD